MLYNEENKPIIVFHTDPDYENLYADLEIRPLNSSQVGIFWGDFVANIYVYCLDHLELRDGFNGRKTQIKDDLDFIKEKKPFNVNMNICKNGKTKFQIVFVLLNKKGKLFFVGTKKFK